jgi:hypothetical protein
MEPNVAEEMAVEQTVVGGGSKVEESPKGISELSPVLELEVLGDCMKIPCPRTAMTVMAKLKALASSPGEDGEDSRAPITICAAIDRSSSMRPHLPLLKETLLFMIQQLRPKDQLCLVTYNEEVLRIESGLLENTPNSGRGVSLDSSSNIMHASLHCAA